MIGRALVLIAAVMLMAGSPMPAGQRLCGSPSSLPGKDRPQDDCAKLCHAMSERKRGRP